MADEITTEEKKPTDYDLLAKHIAEMEADQRVSFNLWRQASIESCKRELERWFDAEGAAVDPEYPVPVNDNVSPLEVQGAEGWYEDQGLEVSVARSNGCVQIRKLVDTAAWYRDHADEVAQQFGASVRIIRMMGENLAALEWYMLPTHDISPSAAPKFRVPYDPMMPAVPFNDAERELFAHNFRKFHFYGAALVGGGLQSNTMQRPTGEVIEGHKIWTLVNHPQDIIPAVADHYNKTGWLRRKYQQMLLAAHAIDRGTRGRIAGYSKPVDQGGPDVQNSREMVAWYNQFEDGALRNIPKLQAGP